jgi:leucyl-tRNA synthetase
LSWDEAAIKEEIVTIVVQVNGKLIDRLSVPKGTVEAKLIEQAKSSEKVARRIGDQPIRKVVYVPDKLISLVV